MGPIIVVETLPHGEFLIQIHIVLVSEELIELILVDLVSRLCV